MNRKKCFLVLGGSGEIGSSIVQLLIEEGADVFFTYNENESKADELRKKGAKGIQWNLKKDFHLDQLKQQLELIENFELLDGIIYSIGISPETILNSKFKKIDELNDIEFESLNKYFVIAPYYSILRLQPFFKRDGGNFVFINTLDGVKTRPGNIAFSQCRSSIKGLIESSSCELGPLNIKINQLCLGVVKSNIQMRLPKEVQEKYIKHCSLGRFATITEVATLASWLVINNTYMTGESVIMDGAL